MMKYKIADAKCLVVKVGSSLLVDNTTGRINRKWLRTLIDDIVHFWQAGLKVVLVSSGSVALGCHHLQLKNGDLHLEEKQAAAAVGQIKLAHVYEEMLKKHGITVAQILLTINDSENRISYINIKNTLETLLALRAIPIINENDTTATNEIQYGDNDRLAARVAQMIGADTLVLLSDIEGLYTANPQLHPTAQFIPEVKKLTPEILAMADESISDHGSGGMITKLSAAKIVLSSGCRMVIAPGKYFNPLTRIDLPSQCTWFVPKTSPIKARKNWIAHHLQPQGILLIDAGAIIALTRGKSLLSVGVLKVQGEFRKGDAVCVLSENKQEIARGIVNYAAHEAKKIVGKKSCEIEKILGYLGSEEIVHRSDLVITAGEKI
jgi:glutamate 5-kinase